MLIALDYDQTYTRDPDFWDIVISAGRARGHEFVCVTQRPHPPGSTRSERVPPIPVVCAGEEFKEDAARRAGYRVHVWIDDMPSTINQPIPLVG